MNSNQISIDREGFMRAVVAGKVLLDEVFRNIMEKKLEPFEIVLGFDPEQPRVRINTSDGRPQTMEPGATVRLSSSEEPQASEPDGEHFVEFFVCPYCGRPLVRKERYEDYVKASASYCGMCGKKIANAFAEALAEVKKEND